MFRADALQLIQLVLELFAQTAHIPIAMYEFGENGDVIETLRANENLFPLHCHKVWELENGKGRESCNLDMCKRAKKAMTSLEVKAHLCHAGLSNVTEPIVIEKKVVAAIQYGAYLSDEENSNERLNMHERAMRKLKASPIASTEIKEHLFNSTPYHTSEELERLRQTLSPILKRILVLYILQKEREHNIQVAANHEIQLKLQAILALAENFLLDLPSDLNTNLTQPLLEIIAATEACGTVMHSLTLGDYLPQDYNFQWHSVRKFIDHAIGLCHAQAMKKGIRLILDFQPHDSKVFIQASEAHLQEAFNNVLQNAVKYSYRTTQQSNERYVKIRGRYSKNGYELNISNYGIGIEPDEFIAIFTGGYKGRLTRAEYRTGSGQGLALTKRIIERHYGTISVSSEPQGGSPEDGSHPYLTRFMIWLPLKQSEIGD